MAATLETHQRIERIINQPAFATTLEAQGSCLIDFQCTWHKYGTVENMPPAFQAAIQAGERAEASENDILAGSQDSEA